MNGLKKSGNVYRDLYRDHTLYVKASSANMEGRDFEILTSTINALVRDGVRIILSYSGRAQIETMGNAKNIADVLCCRIQKALPMAHHADAVLLDLDLPRPLVTVGFMGGQDGQETFVEPDDVALQIVRRYHNHIHEMFILSPRGGIRDKKGDVVPLVDEVGLGRIIRRDHDKIDLPEADRKRMILPHKILPFMKVALTSAAELQPEIELWTGGDTSSLLYHSDLVHNAPLDQEREGGIFDAVYATNVKNGNFKARTPDEVEILKRNHYVLRVKGSPIGGYTLYPHADGWSEVSAVWSSHIGGGVGDRLLRRAKEQARLSGAAASDTSIFALTSEALVPLFTNAGFTHHGTVSQVRNSSRELLPAYVQEYDSPGRNPHVVSYVESFGNGSS